MSKRVLTIVLAMALAIGVFGTVANAGVEGSFTFDISIKPQHAIPYYDCVSTTDIPDIAKEAHGIKADLEDLQTDLGGYWIIGDAYKQLLLELADYTLPGDQAAIKGKIAEIMDLLDEQVTSLKTDLAAIPTDICTEVDVTWVDGLLSDITALFNKINTNVTRTGKELDELTQDFAPPANTTWDTLNTTFEGWLTAQTASVTYKGTPGTLVYLAGGDKVSIESEWDEFTTKAGDMWDEALKLGKKYLIIEKTIQELRKAAIDCNDPDGHGITDIYTYITKLNGYLDDVNLEIDALIVKADFFKDNYKHFLDKQVGLLEDEVTPVHIYDLDLAVDISHKFGPTPTSELQVINALLVDIKAEKTTIEATVKTIKDKYAKQTKIAGYIADLDPIYDKLQFILTKKWTGGKVCTWKFRDVGPFEYQKFKFDFEGKLLLDLTFSGLTISNNLAMGLGGIEHYIISLSTTLGALDLKDEFWFAAPYAKVIGPYGQSNYLRVGALQFVKKKVHATITIGGLEAGTHLVFEDVNFNHPYPYPAAVPPKYGFGMWFTLKGVTVSGIGVENLTALNVDPQVLNKVKKYSQYGRVVKQPDFDIPTTKLGQDYITESYTLGAATPTYLNSTITVDNVTATVTGEWTSAGLVVGPFDWFEKEITITNTGTRPVVIVVSSSVDSSGPPWMAHYVDCQGARTPGTPPDVFWPYTPETFELYPGEVNLCYVGGWIDGGSVGTSYTMWDNIAVFKAGRYVREAPWLAFTVEKINITGIPLGLLTLDSYLEFRPGKPIAEKLVAKFSLMGLAMVTTLKTTDITTFNISSVTLTAALDTYFTITITDGDGTLMLDNPATDSIKVVSSIPIQAATLSNYLKIVPTKGVTSANFGISIPVGIGTFTSKVYYTGSPMKMSKWSFALSSTVGGLTFNMSSTFKMTGLDKANISIGVPFSV